MTTSLLLQAMYVEKKCKRDVELCTELLGNLVVAVRPL